MTVSKHKFDGYNIRIQKRNIMCQQYVGASLRNYDGTKAQRFGKAFADARILREKAKALLNNAKSWSDQWTLKRQATVALTNLGFKIKKLQ